jgi:phospholipid transport system substrate-binding protein
MMFFLSTSTGPTRRIGRQLALSLAVAIGVGVTVGATVTRAQAVEVAAGSADAMVLGVSNGVLDAIRGDKSLRNGDLNHLQGLVNDRIIPHVDFDRMTRLTVGKPWRTATPAQRSAIMDQFRLLLMRTYAGALKRVSDEKIRLKPSRVTDIGDDVIVRTEIVASQGEPIQIDYRVEKADGDWKIFDMNILGVWLVENYKNEFRDTLNQSGVDGLIQALTEKNRKAQGRS